jgi:hypothetical protein
VTERDEDELWRSIVANYGDRAEILDAEPPAPPAPPPAPLPTPPGPATAPVAEDPPERFVPPPPPPIPRPDSKRLVAWLGVLGMPVALLVLQLADLAVVPLVGYAMAAWFLGGFGYLVWQMPSGPRDPGDDGARL